MANVDRASFMYGSNDQMTTEVKTALAAFDLDKTGRVSTSELVAGAKALQEVRGQNSFMRKILLIHSVTMGLLLAGMFGLSMAAMELSKETKVGTEHTLVTQKGEAVLVGSSDMYIVPSADGTPELRQRSSGDERRLDGDDSLVTVGTSQAVLDLTGDDSRRLQEGKWKALNRLTYNNVFAFLAALKRSVDRNTFFIVLESGDDGVVEVQASVMRKTINGQQVKLQLMILGTVGTVRCVRRNDKCFVYMEKNDGFRNVEQSTLCMKKGLCPKDAWESLAFDAQDFAVSDEDASLDQGSNFWSWSEIGMAR